MDFAAQNGVPTIYPSGVWVAAGGLMSYSPSAIPFLERAAAQVDKLLRGARPAELPIEQPQEFELAVRLTTAVALGLTIPPAVAAQVTKWVQSGGSRDSRS